MKSRRRPKGIKRVLPAEIEMMRRLAATGATIWQRSGKWEQRGRGQGYVMCRRGDSGPYAEWNVFIATAAENSSKQGKKKSGLPTGVRQSGKAMFVAMRMVDGQKLKAGPFPTPEQAYSAYVSLRAA